MTLRGRSALALGSAARWASRVTGRGAGAMIGGLVAMTLDPSVLRQLGLGRRTAVVTGTEQESTTTRMVAAALRTIMSGGAGPPTSDRTSDREAPGRRHQTVATNAEGANMDAGLVAALAADRDARLAALEVDEMHVRTSPTR